MNRWKVILATLVIFASGVATGLLLSGNEDPQPGLEPAAAPRVITPGAPPPVAWQRYQREFMNRLNKAVDLSPEQRRRINTALKESQERTKSIRDKIAPELQHEVKRIREQIRSELTPEQQATFDEAMAQPAPKPAPKTAPKQDEKRRQPAKDISKAPGTSQPVPQE